MVIKMPKEIKRAKSKEKLMQTAKWKLKEMD
jgi:hypothetical protein